MAKITALGISGIVGNVVYYKTPEGIQLVKSKPLLVKQTAATKACASKFGLASGSARMIRQGFYSFLTPLNNRHMRNRLTTAVYEWMQSNPAHNGDSYIPVSTLCGFEFNKEVSMRKVMTSALQVDWGVPGKVTINIPALNPHIDIKAPAATASVDIWLGVMNCLVGNDALTSSRSTIIQIPYTSRSIAPREIELTTAVLPNSLNVIAMGLRYNVTGSFVGLTPEMSLKWMPACIVDAVHKG